jgi:hypothetical protein
MIRPTSNWVTIQDRVTTGDEEIDARHPLGDMTLSEIAQLYADLKATYPQYKDFRYEHHFKGHGYGAVTYWYDLEGLENEET